MRLKRSAWVCADSASKENDGRPLLDSLAGLHANQSRAEGIGEAGRHLAMEVLHPNNVARYNLRQKESIFIYAAFIFACFYVPWLIMVYVLVLVCLCSLKTTRVRECE